MDENLFESVQYAAWVFLFIFALSFGIFQYSRISSVIDQFVAVNMFNDRGTGTGVYLDEDEVERVASRAELFMSILNLPDTIRQNGNSNYEIQIDGIVIKGFYDDYNGDGVTIGSYEYYTKGIYSKDPSKRYKEFDGFPYVEISTNK